MSNTFFRFKQFIIHQDQCAMKVCTDACLFGAWVARHFTDSNKATPKILDIGTGTGLLSLMLAQQLMGNIDAVEIDPPAATQALANFSASAWKERITVHHMRVQEFLPISQKHSYDVIISNPPFFENDLKSLQSKKNLAKHESNLSLQQLLFISDTLLQSHGTIALLLPWNRQAQLMETAATLQLYPLEIVNVRQSADHPYFRTMVLLQKNRVSPFVHEIAIKNHDGKYSDEFAGLLRDYYLYL